MSKQVFTTKEYDRFTLMEGNRSISRTHVNELKRLIQKSGNLTMKFPIKVDPKGNVLDGQHRLAALRELNETVAYEVIEGADIEMVRAINLGNRNWTWRDIAESHDKLGNKEYGWFLQFVDDYQLPFQVALSFCDSPLTRGQDSTFYRGGFVAENKELAIERATHYRDVRDITGLSHRDFALGLRLLTLHENYEPERMVKKLAERGDTLPPKATRFDYARALEDIYNYKMGEANRVRLF